MLVRGFPSISAQSVLSGVDSDWLRKGIVLTLLLASVANGWGSVQHILCFCGISLACLILLANLGARAWGFMQWRPIQNFGFMEPIVSFLAAVFTGIMFPFLGHRQVESGGKAALESTMGIALLSGIIFVLSDYDNIQRFVVMGSENCDQDTIVLTMGIWWTIATLCSVGAVYRKGRQGIWPDDEEPLLLKDHASPVGFKVPNLPDFPIDSALAQRSIFCLGIHFELGLMLVATLAMGGFMCFLAFTQVDNDL